LKAVDFIQDADSYLLGSDRKMGQLPRALCLIELILYSSSTIYSIR